MLALLLLAKKEYFKHYQAAWCRWSSKDFQSRFSRNVYFRDTPVCGAGDELCLYALTIRANCVYTFTAHGKFWLTSVVNNILETLEAIVNNILVTLEAILVRIVTVEAWIVNFAITRLTAQSETVGQSMVHVEGLQFMFTTTTCTICKLLYNKYTIYVEIELLFHKNCVNFIQIVYFLHMF